MFKGLMAGGAVALMLAGCGGGGDSNSSASSREKAQQAALDFARCMRGHGIPMADPKADGGITLSIHAGGPSETAVMKAQAACQHFLKGAIKPPSAAERQKMTEAALKWAQCMRSNGVSVPDPTSGPGGGAIKIGPGPGHGPGPNDAAFQRADTKCRHLLPGRGGPPGATVQGQFRSGGSVGAGPGPGK
jgi:hypothetical protein